MKINKFIILGLGVLLIILSFVIRGFKVTVEGSIDGLKEYRSTNTENEEAYMYIDFISSHNDNMFIVYKDNVQYAIKVKSGLVNKMLDTRFDGKTIKLVGKTSAYSQEDKAALAKSNNDKYSESQESQIDADEVTKFFGNYYLEVNKIVDDTLLGETNKSICNLLLEMGIVLCLLFVFYIFVKKYED